MTIEQTVEVPANHRVAVFFDIPFTVPAGQQVTVALDLAERPPSAPVSGAQALLPPIIAKWNKSKPPSLSPFAGSPPNPRNSLTG
jgi:hypothetical protein